MTKNRAGIHNYGLTIQEVKDYLKVTTSTEDTIYAALISSSYEAVVNETGRDFISASYTTYVSGSTSAYLGFDYVYSVNTGSLVNSTDGAYATFDAPYEGYITYTVAADSTTLPGPVRVSMLMLVSHWSEHRNPFVVGASISNFDFAIEALLSPYKITKP